MSGKLIKSLSRREFLKGSGGLAGSFWTATHMPVLLALGQTACTSRENAAGFNNLADGEARELAAISAQIIPTTDTPGAQEAGVIYFIDEALGGFMAGAADFIRSDLKELLADNGGEFSSLTSQQQLEALTRIEQDRFFGVMRFLTVTGMFCMPIRGGNRNHVGWQLLGFDHQHAWQPPFGYYDAKEGNANV